MRPLLELFELLLSPSAESSLAINLRLNLNPDQRNRAIRVAKNYRLTFDVICVNKSKLDFKYRFGTPLAAHEL